MKKKSFVSGEVAAITRRIHPTMSKATEKRVNAVLFGIFYAAIVLMIALAFVVPAIMFEKQARADRKADTAVIVAKMVERKADSATKKAGVALDKAAKNHDTIEKIKEVVSDTQSGKPIMTKLQRIHNLRPQGE